MISDRLTDSCLTNRRFSAKIRSQRPIVSEPETISAMGFAVSVFLMSAQRNMYFAKMQCYKLFKEMSDGVAMLTQARQNLMFTMAALSREQRSALEK